MLNLHPVKLLLLALLVAAVGCGSPATQPPVIQQPASPAPLTQAQITDAVYTGWLSAYQVADGNNIYLAKSFTDRSAGSWSQAYLIFEAEDAYFQNHSATRYAQITQLLNDFLAKHSSDWTGDSWDDDLEWMIYAFIRGYEITGNTTYLTAAANNWNAVYARGWDTTKFANGGIYENLDDLKPGSDPNLLSKCVLSNAPFVIEGIELYRATGTASYLTTSQQVYEWTRTNLFNSTSSTNALGAPGQANECIHSYGLATSDNAYNTGLMLNAANSLYRATQSPEYYGDVQLAATHFMGKWPIVNKDYPQNGWFSADQLFRGLAAFATQNNLWSTYGTYLQNNATASWNERRTDFNFTHNDFTTPTPTTGDLYSMEVGASLTLQASIPISFPFSGNYELQNVNSGLALDVSGRSTSSGAAIVQNTYTGAASQLWTLVATAGGCYQIKNASSGLVLNVSGASTTSGALLQQSAAQPMQPGNDQWYPALNADGTYSFYNLNSLMALDVPGASTSTGTQLDQSFANNATNQKFNLIAR